MANFGGASTSGIDLGFGTFGVVERAKQAQLDPDKFKKAQNSTFWNNSILRMTSDLGKNMAEKGHLDILN